MLGILDRWKLIEGRNGASVEFGCLRERDCLDCRHLPEGRKYSMLEEIESKALDGKLFLYVTERERKHRYIAPAGAVAAWF